AIVGDRPDDERASFVERALRIGLLALQSAGTTLNVDLVRAEFDKLVRQSEQANERAAQALDLALRTNFADGEGRLPRTLDRFLGEHGQLQALVGELFDEKKRDSAIGRIGTMLERYFDGDASKLAQLLDPTRASSPLHQFRGEITERFDRLSERIVALEAAGQARGAERAKSAAKGADFEDLLEALLADVARGSGDLLDRTGGETGDVMRSKKGDFVLSVSDALARGADLRIVVEAKDRAVSGREMREELREAKANRNACVALVVFTPSHAPSGIAPFDVRAGDVYCVVDPEAPDPASLEAAVRLARLLALATLREIEAEIDAEALAAALTEIRQQLDVVKGIKATLTSIGRNAAEVSVGLDRLREAILQRVAEAETELRTRRAVQVH
ncbi:MAG TPA: hypothetical protein VFI28_13835, partial [Candidatus Limnocylindrales bacterium]|nr:hypothetical protein [Candidatus Limnocylindrales bacterium]